jgi:UDP-galactopyranose mutase
MQIFEDADLIVVGAGFSGLTIAERANALGFKTVILERRSHIGGNAYSYIDPGTGVEVHKYGPHIFHTTSATVFEYLSQFTDWVSYEHRPWTSSRGKVYSLPINLGTISSFLGRYVTPAEARRWVAEQAAEVKEPQNLEEKAISLIGRPLYETFIRGYTLKQWQTDPRQLPPEIITRLPVRFTFDNRYFNDVWQFMPKNGYTPLFENMINGGNINVHYGVDWLKIRQHTPNVPVVYTGPVDEYFSYKLGRLGWRTQDFQLETYQGDYQGCSVMSYADEDIPWTRITEFKHFHPERSYGPDTVIAREFSRAAGANDEPYYPINTPADKKLYEEYRQLAAAESDVVFVGRLATYRYLDMHQAIAAALKTFEVTIKPRLLSPVLAMPR